MLHSSRRRSQCTHSNHPIEQWSTPFHRHRHTQARAAPFTTHADDRKPTRSAPARVGQFRHHPHLGGTHAATPPHGASSLAACVPDPCSHAASAQRPSAAACASWEPVHTRQPLAGGLHPSAPRRPTPRRPRNSLAAPQARPDARRTVKEPREPLGVDAERAW